MTVSLAPPFPIYLDKAGNPIDAGFVYVGTANANPVSSPVAVFWDAALLIAASQPIRTLNGYASNNGSPGNLYTAGDFSITVCDQNNIQQFTSPSNPFRVGSVGGVTLATGERLAALSGSFVDMRDGSEVLLGNSAGTGVVVRVAGNARFDGNIVPSAASAYALGSLTRRWNACLATLNMAAGFVTGSHEVSGVQTHTNQLAMQGQVIKWTVGVTSSSANALTDEDFSKASCTFSTAAGVLTVAASKALNGVPTIDAGGYVIVNLTNAMASTKYRVHCQYMGSNTVGTPPGIWLVPVIVSTTQFRIYAYTVAAGVPTAALFNGGGGITSLCAFDILGIQ